MRVRLERACKGRGNRCRALLLDAAHRHAHVLGLDHHRHAARMQGVVDRMGDLRGHGFLGLKPAAENFDHAGNLRQAQNLAVGKIGNMCLANDRHHVVFAMREERNILDQNDVVIAGNFFKGTAKLVFGVLFGTVVAFIG